MTMSGGATATAATSAYAGFLLRFVAAIIDGIILGIVIWLVALVLGALTGSVVLATIVSYLVGGVAGLLYWGKLESGKDQATIGKKVMKIKVTDMNGGALDFATAVKRSWPHWLGSFVAIVDILLGLNFVVTAIIGLAALVSCLMVLFTPMKQGFHDKMASALVVKS